MLWSIIMKKVFVFFLSCYLAILLASYFDLFWFCMTLVIGHSFTRLHSMNFCCCYSLSFLRRNLAAICFGGLHNWAIVWKHNWVIVFYKTYLYGFSQNAGRLATSEICTKYQNSSTGEIFRSSRSHIFFNRDSLKNFALITKKHLC